jgi:hypothetical protein
MRRRRYMGAVGDGAVALASAYDTMLHRDSECIKSKHATINKRICWGGMGRVRPGDKNDRQTGERARVWAVRTTPARRKHLSIATMTMT